MIQHRRPGNKNKIYVQVMAHHKFDGILMPLYFGLESGERIKVDKVLIMKRAAARKAGGQGMLYEVLGTPEQDADTLEPPPQQRFFLFHDDPYWFIEVDDQEVV